MAWNGAGLAVGTIDGLSGLEGERTSEVYDEAIRELTAKRDAETDPERRAYPGGRGVMLMKHFMSRVEFNDAGNAVVMEKEPAKE